VRTRDPDLDWKTLEEGRVKGNPEDQVMKTPVQGRVKTTLEGQVMIPVEGRVKGSPGRVK
jgi:hypothetical protein